MKNGGAVLPETESFFSAAELQRFRAIADERAGGVDSINQLTQVDDVDLARNAKLLAPFDKDDVLVSALRRHLLASVQSLEVDGRPLFHLRTNIRSGPQYHARMHGHPDIIVLVHPLTKATLGTVFEKTDGGLLTMPSKITTAIGTSIHRAPNTPVSRHSLFTLFGFKAAFSETADSVRNSTDHRVYDWHGERVRRRRPRRGRR